MRTATMALSPLLTWIVFRLVALWGHAPMEDDASSFLAVSQIPPLLMFTVALAMFGGS